MRRQHRILDGFTLVELLVVIAIITLLISILLPSLGKAREAAMLVADQSNMRQVLQSVHLYSNENMGKLPIASSAHNWGEDGTNPAIFIALNKYLGREIDPTGTVGDPNGIMQRALSPVFTCNQAATANGAPGAWNEKSVRTTRFNPRGFPGYDQHSTNTNLTVPYPQRKLSSIRNAAEKIATFEGAQIPSWNWCPEPEAIMTDGWRWNGTGADQHLYLDPPPAHMTDWAHYNGPITSGLNRDDGWWVNGVRYRHRKETVTPVGFFDGHVETRTAKTFMVREICVNP